MNFIKYLQAAGVPDELHSEALESFAEADRRAALLSPYKWSAPFVMAWVVPKLPWDAEHLPANYARYDNDVSINGDPWPWKEVNGEWIRFAPIEDTPEARAKCYWANGSHPRSKWARYVWLGWRNRATSYAAELGVPAELGISVWGNHDVSNALPGVAVYRMGKHWQILVVEKVRGLPLVVRKNYGFKINNVLNNQHTVANVTTIAFSLLRYKGA